MGRQLIRAAAAAIALIALLPLPAGCGRPPAPKQYEFDGQVLAVDKPRQLITLKHGDIAGFMPAMTMMYPVAPGLLDGRTAGELIRGTLEVGRSAPTIVAITHVGTAPLPENSNAVAMASGVLAAGDEVPDVALVDQQNRRRSFAEWKGSITLLTFIYTRCPLPNFCPLMDQRLAHVQRRLTEIPSLAARVKLVTVSFDPEFDTPDVLARHAAKLKADPSIWTFLTGDRAAVEEFAARFGVGVIRETQDPAQVTHNLRTTLIDASGRVAKIYSGTEWDADAVVADMRALTESAGR